MTQQKKTYRFSDDNVITERITNYNKNTKSAVTKIRICGTTILQLILMQNKRPKKHHTNVTIKS